jgi:hypothetical protein
MPTGPLILCGIRLNLQGPRLREEKVIRSIIFAALVAATTISVASAEGVSTPSQPPPVPTDNVGDKSLGL